MAAAEKCMLVLFVDDIGETKSVDIVPAKWIFYDDKRDHMVTPFITNCSKANLRILHDLVQSEGEPLQSWDLHRISINGSAISYAEAKKKVEERSTKTFVFTMDSEQHAKEKAHAITKKYKLKRNKNDKQNVEELFAASTFDINNQPEKSPRKTIKNRSMNGWKLNTSRKKVVLSKVSKNIKAPTFGRRPQKNKQRKISPIKESENEKSSSEPSQFEVNEQFDADGTNLTSADDSDEDAYVKQRRKRYETLKKSKERNPSDFCNPAKTLAFVRVPRDDNNNGVDRDSSTHDVGMRRQQFGLRPQSGECSSKASGKKSTGGNDRNGPHGTENPVFPTGALDIHDSDDLKTVVMKCYRRLPAQIGQLQAQVADIKIRQTEITSVTSGHSSKKIEQITGIDSTVEKHNLGELPFKTLNEFKQFDDKLRSNKSIRNEIAHSMVALVNLDPKYLTRSTRDIIQRFMPRDVLLKFTAARRKSGEKIIFKQETTFYICMRDAILSKFSDKECDTKITEKNIHDTIGTVINNFKDWDGHRQSRKKVFEDVTDKGSERGSKEA